LEQEKNNNGRKILLRLLIIIIGIVILIMGANSNTKVDEKIGEVKLTADVIKEFKGDIILNYFDSKGYNIIFELNKAKNYNSTIKVPAGKYTLESADVDEGYKVDVPDEIKIAEGKPIKLNVKVVAKNSKDKDSKVKNTKKTDNKPLEKESKKAFKLGNTGIFTLVIMAILVIMLIYMKIRNLKNIN